METGPGQAAQTNTQTVWPTHLLGINPLELLDGVLSLEGESALSANWSVIYTGRVILFTSPLISTVSGESVSGGGGSLGLHYFTGGQALHGFWLGPEVGVEYASITVGTLSGSGAGVNITGNIGYTCFPGDHVYLSFGVGIGWATIGASVTDSNANTYYAGQSGVAYSGRASIGGAW